MSFNPESFSWLKFHIEHSEIHFEVWVLLGEVRSKCEHIRGVPLAPEIAEKMYKAYLIKGVQATTAIEGNTLSQEEIAKILEGRRDLPLSKRYMGVEVDNMGKAFMWLLNEVVDGDGQPITPERIKALNAMVLDGQGTDEIVPGEFRQHNVTVGRYLAPKADEVPDLVERLCEWLNGPEFKSPPEMRIPSAVLKAAMAHLYTAWIHPFADGNGRTARLLEYQILLDAGIPSSSGHVLSNHYNNTRTEYYRELDQASRSGGHVGPFLRYAAQGFVDGLAEQVGMIKEYMKKVVWRDFVRNLLPVGSLADRRRRRLLLDLGDQTRPVPKHMLRSISERVAKQYENKHIKTLTRDLNILLAEDVIRETGAGYEANFNRILELMPLARLADDETELRSRAS